MSLTVRGHGGQGGKAKQAMLRKVAQSTCLLSVMPWDDEEARQTPKPGPHRSQDRLASTLPTLQSASGVHVQSRTARAGSDTSSSGRSGAAAWHSRHGCGQGAAGPSLATAELAETAQKLPRGQASPCSALDEFEAAVEEMEAAPDDGQAQSLRPLGRPDGHRPRKLHALAFTPGSFAASSAVNSAVTGSGRDGDASALCASEAPADQAFVRRLKAAGLVPEEIPQSDDSADDQAFILRLKLAGLVPPEAELVGAEIRDGDRLGHRGFRVGSASAPEAELEDGGLNASHASRAVHRAVFATAPAALAPEPFAPLPRPRRQSLAALNSEELQDRRHMMPSEMSRVSRRTSSS